MAVNRGEIMKNIFSSIGSVKALRMTALAALGMSVSACNYDGGVGIGYASGGGYSGYQCDPYSPFDNYYDCDYGYGFSNIGYGGGWYNGFYYPGYGTYLFDNYGQRYGMQNDYRRYWAQRRYDWNRGDRHDNRGYQGGYQGGRRDGHRQDYQPRNQVQGIPDSGAQPSIPHGRVSRSYSPPAQSAGSAPERVRPMERAQQPQIERAAPSWHGQARDGQASGGHRRLESPRPRRNQR
jgi:hypothetical protein